MSLIVVVCDLNIAQFQLQGTVRIAERGDLLLQVVLRRVGFRLRLFVLGLTTMSTNQGKRYMSSQFLPSTPRPRIARFRLSLSAGVRASQKPRYLSPAPPLTPGWRLGSRQVRPQVAHIEPCNAPAHPYMSCLCASAQRANRRRPASSRNGYPAAGWARRRDVRKAGLNKSIQSGQNLSSSRIPITKRIGLEAHMLALVATHGC